MFNPRHIAPGGPHTAVVGREATDHVAMGHGEHEGHGAKMVRDFLRRFVVSTIMSLPLVIFSPVGATFGLPSMRFGSFTWH